MAMTAPASAPVRNPGPSWGYRFLRLTDRVLPEFIFRPLRALGTWVALAGMPGPRNCSREYLTVMLGRTPRLREIFRHFFFFEETLMLRLRVANGREIGCDYMTGADDFRTWLESGEPVLLGTMHVGVSDLLGFQLADLMRHPVHLVRLRVGNSHDTEALARRFGSRVRFIWINEPADLLYALKEALHTPGAVAVQCDRIERGSRTEAFYFLGARRLFPFTIYHLALIFDRPILLSFGVLGPAGRSQLFASPLFQRESDESRENSLARARVHFQNFLRLVETQLHANPYLWFNFIPLNAAVPPRKTEAA